MRRVVLLVICDGTECLGGLAELDATDGLHIFKQIRLPSEAELITWAETWCEENNTPLHDIMHRVES